MTHNFIGFESWPAKRLIDEVVRVCVEDKKMSRDEAAFAVSLLLFVANSLVQRENDLAVIKSKVFEWKDAAEDENMRLFNLSLPSARVR